MTPGSSRLLKIGTAVGSLAVLVAAILVFWPLAWSDKPMLRPSEAERLFGETVGRVSKVEASTNTIHVSSRPLGGGALPFVVTKDTKVMVGYNEGAFGDLREGKRVRVAYEFRQGRRLASDVEVLPDDGTSRAGGVEPRATGAARPPAGERMPVTGNVGGGQSQDVRPAGVPKASERAPQVRRGETPAREQTSALKQASAPKQAEIPAPVWSAAPAPTRSPASTTPPARSQEPAQPQELMRSQDTTRAQDADAPDPSAVIDWLLRERGR